MKRKLLLYFAIRYLLYFIGWYVIGRVCYYLQENFYTGPNILYPIEQALGFQTSSTSFAYAIFVCYLLMSMICVVFYLFRSYNFKAIKGMMYAYCGIVLFAGIVHEAKQIAHPPYPDNNYLDIALSVVGVGLVVFHIWKKFPDDI